SYTCLSRSYPDNKGDPSLALNEIWNVKNAPVSPLLISRNERDYKGSISTKIKTVPVFICKKTGYPPFLIIHHNNIIK
ncbi:MAG: hypothetical protein M3036_07295, partial [Bifidobacteriales bacterium]|nr:hypothetical protein [Bifidobacteriales bacterium]